MNNKNLMIIAVIGIMILAIAGGGLYIANQNSKDSKVAMEEKAMMKDDSMNDEVTKDDKMMADSEGMMNDSKYTEYSKSNLDSASEDKRVLYFYANWCPICRPVDTNLKNGTTKIPEGVKIVRVNFNDPDTDQEEKDLAKKYGVTSQHTFVQIDENGNQLGKWSAEDIEIVLDSLK